MILSTDNGGGRRWLGFSRIDYHPYENEYGSVFSQGSMWISEALNLIASLVSVHEFYNRPLITVSIRVAISAEDTAAPPMISSDSSISDMIFAMPELCAAVP